VNCADDGINCEERQRLEAEIERLHAENAELLAAISRIDAINDNPACYNPEINEVCDKILRPRRG